MEIRAPSFARSTVVLHVQHAQAQGQAFALVGRGGRFSLVVVEGELCSMAELSPEGAPT